MKNLENYPPGETNAGLTKEGKRRLIGHQIEDMVSGLGPEAKVGIHPLNNGFRIDFEYLSMKKELPVADLNEQALEAAKDVLKGLRDAAHSAER